MIFRNIRRKAREHPQAEVKGPKSNLIELRRQYRGGTGVEAEPACLEAGTI